MKIDYRVKLLVVLIFILLQTFDTFIETRLNINHDIIFYSSYIGFAAFLIISSGITNFTNIFFGFVTVLMNITVLNFTTIAIVFIIQIFTKGIVGFEDLISRLNSGEPSDLTFASFKELGNSISEFILVIMVVILNHYVRASWESSFKWRVIGGYLMINGFLGMSFHFVLNLTPIILSGLIIPFYIILVNSTFVYIIEQNTAVIQRKPYAVIVYDFYKIISPIHIFLKKYFA